MSRYSGKGFTLIEVIMIIVVAGIAIPVLLVMIGQEARLGVSPELHVTASNLGQALMEEMRAKCWDDTAVSGSICNNIGASGSTLGVDLGETVGNPTTYDDIDDYVAGVPDVNVGGVSYLRAVSVCYINSTVPDTCQAGTSNYKRIEIRVANPQIGTVKLVTLRTRY